MIQAWRDPMAVMTMVEPSLKPDQKKMSVKYKLKLSV